jgi:hypothetical protein
MPIQPNGSRKWPGWYRAVWRPENSFRQLSANWKMLAVLKWSPKNHKASPTERIILKTAVGKCGNRSCWACRSMSGFRTPTHLECSTVVFRIMNIRINTILIWPWWVHSATPVSWSAVGLLYRQDAVKHLQTAFVIAMNQEHRVSSGMPMLDNV